MAKAIYTLNVMAKALTYQPGRAQFLANAACDKAGRGSGASISSGRTGIG
jgi:hypothetical protein